MKIYPTTTLTTYLALFTTLQSIQLTKCDQPFKQLHIFFRHGERSPTETYKNDPYVNFTWSGGWGQLTNVGKLQMYLLGEKLREVYKEFIPEYYYKEDVEVQSSYADRCLMSAECLLAGMFPPKGEQIWNGDLLWQPIPIKYVPRNQDNLIAMKKSCKIYDEEYQKVLKSEEIKQIDSDNSKLYDYLTAQTGDPINNIAVLELLYNTLEIELLHNLTLPPWTKNVSLTHMKQLAAKSLAIFTQTDYMKRMKGGVFLNRTIHLMKNDKTLLHLYSGHDISIVNILRTMGVIDVLKPGFGASFVMELHKDNEVKLFYRNGIDEKSTEFLLPSCGSPCFLWKFEDILEPLLPVNWEEECDL